MSNKTTDTVMTGNDNGKNSDYADDKTHVMI